MKLPAEVSSRIEAYLALLARWNARINLVGPSSPDSWRLRHIEDCLQLLPLLPPGEGPIADLGSGAGLPGLILAAATDREVHLVESDQKKCAFLREAIRTMGLSRARVHPIRVEQVRLPPLEAVTARALAPLARLLPHAHRLLAPGGVAIFPKGRQAEAELTEAARHWHMTVERFGSRTDPEATIFRIRDLRPA
ncbi:MAG: 16S rRNA (guanine(527)-N(7))-methyltransferase RsmG [Rhodovarius sp.]|nr:16S rRNA (guanine(527)-N(7))-methyltransferase RsmG [Rhodovarius sp.]MCX7933236.1 16S rRNA (guanine(527)-N(7))-methyltransferase RsmG [Rhodovarius sp.]MDW8314425.1 16S rRNA (guanine(527)-N(7))-methyltransferase RsmG [Rhodovarius sp.]